MQRTFRLITLVTVVSLLPIQTDTFLEQLARWRPSAGEIPIALAGFLATAPATAAAAPADPLAPHTLILQPDSLGIADGEFIARKPTISFDETETRGPGVSMRRQTPGDPPLEIDLRLRGVGGRIALPLGGGRGVQFRVPADGRPDGSLAPTPRSVGLGSLLLHAPAAPTSATPTISATATPSGSSTMSTTSTTPAATSATAIATATGSPTAAATAPPDPALGGNRYGAALEVRYEPDAAGSTVKETLIFADRPRTSIIEWELDTGDRPVAIQPDGSLAIADWAGRPVATVAAPTFRDARGRAGTATYRLGPGPRQLEVVLDDELVRAGQLPLEVDPTITVNDANLVDNAPPPWQRQSVVMKDGVQAFFFWDEGAQAIKLAYSNSSYASVQVWPTAIVANFGQSTLGQGGFSVEVEHLPDLSTDLIYLAVTGRLNGTTNVVRLIQVTYNGPSINPSFAVTGTLDLQSSAASPGSPPYWSGASIAIERAVEPATTDYLWVGADKKASASQWEYQTYVAPLASATNPASWTLGVYPNFPKRAAPHYGAIVAHTGGITAVAMTDNQQKAATYRRGSGWGGVTTVQGVACNGGRDHSLLAVADPKDTSLNTLVPLVAYAPFNSENMSCDKVELFALRYDPTLPGLGSQWRRVGGGGSPDPIGSTRPWAGLAWDGSSYYVVRVRQLAGSAEIVAERGFLSQGDLGSYPGELEAPRTWVVASGENKTVPWLSLPRDLPSEIIPFFYVADKPTDQLFVEALRLDLLGERESWQYQTIAIPGAGTIQVNLANGNLHYEMVDADFPARKWNDTISRAYDSQRTSPTLVGGDTGVLGLTPLGPGWTGLATSKLEFWEYGRKRPTATSKINRIVYWTGDGGKYVYVGKGNNWSPELGLKMRLERPNEGEKVWRLTDLYGHRQFFNAQGQPVFKEDHEKNPNFDPDHHTWDWDYAGGKLDRITGSAVPASSARVQDATVDAANRLTSIVVQNPGGPAQTYSYQYAGLGGRLSRATLAQGTPAEASVSYGYDSISGLLTTISAPEGQTYSIFYDGAARVSWIDLPSVGGSSPCNKGNGRHCWEFTWYEGINQVVVNDPLNQSWTYKALGGGPVYEQTYPIGLGATATIARTWTGYQDLATETIPVDGATTATTLHEYDDRRNRTLTRDANGRETRYEYDYTWNSSRRNKKTDARGNVTTYTYKTAGSALHSREKTIFPISDTESGTIENTYDDGKGDLLSVKDANGNVTRYEYDAYGQRSKETRPDTSVTVYTRDAWGRVASERVGSSAAAEDTMTTSQYDALGRLTTARVRMNSVDSDHADDLVTLKTYDRNGNLIGVTDPRGGTTTNTYDARGRLMAVNPPPGNDGTNQHRPCTRYVYDERGSQTRVQTATKRTGGTTCWDATDISEWSEVVRTYDERGLKRSESVGGLQGTEWTYNKAGWVTSTTDPNGNVTELAYDLAGHKTSETRKNVSLPGGPRDVQRRWGYDEVYNLKTETTQRGDAVLFEQTRTHDYDKAGRRIRTYDERGKLWSWTYDKNGNKTSETDPTLQGSGLASGEWIYDGLNRVTRFAARRSGTTQSFTHYGFDQRGNRLHHVDPNSNWTTYLYDRANRLQFVMTPVPNSDWVWLIRDKNGNVVQQRDTRLQWTSFAYDALNRKTGETPPAASVQGCGPSCPISAGASYTLDGLPFTATDFSGTVATHSYDAARRLTSVTYSDGTLSVGFGYDANGNRTSMSQGGAAQASWSYDRLNRVRTETRGGSTLEYTYDRRDLVGLRYPDGKQLSYGYDDAGRLTSVGLAAGWTLGSQATFGYDDANRRTSQALPNGASSTWALDLGGRVTQTEYRANGGALLQRHTWTYDPAGNRLSQVDFDGATTISQTFEYDPAHRLKKEIRNGVATEWGYDPAGNRTGLSVNGVVQKTYSYDYDNRLLSISDGTTFEYDRNGSLKRKVEPGNQVTLYGYDGARRLTSVTPPGSGTVTFTYDGLGARTGKTAGGVTTGYLNDTRGLAQVLQATKPGQVVTQVPGLGQHDAAQAGAQAWSFYHADHQNNRALTDGNGQRRWGWEWDPFGQPRTPLTGAPSEFGYAGEQRDGETGLVNLRARYYDPQIGRFLQRDVLMGRPGFPQSLNRYSYALNNPLRAVDPSGYECWSDEDNDFGCFSPTDEDPEPTADPVGIWDDTEQDFAGEDLVSDPADPHIVLGILGFTPVGPVADLVDAGLYAYEGEYGNAAFSALAAVPGLGDAVAAGRSAVVRIVRVVGDEVFEDLLVLASGKRGWSCDAARGLRRKSCGGTDRGRWRSYHRASCYNLEPRRRTER